MLVASILLLVVAIVILCLRNYVNTKRRTVVLESSSAIKELKKINNDFTFAKIVNLDMKNNYDNQAFYQEISPKDYLTYQLVYKGSAVKTAIKDAKENNRLFQIYQSKISDNCKLRAFSINKDEYNDIWIRIERLLNIDYIFKKEHLYSVENNLFNSLIKKPKTHFEIKVDLLQTNIQGSLITSKSAIFDTEEIEKILARLSHKKDGFYLDEGIWQSICRVERGRVSNKMRFAIYERDGHRCKKCGRRNTTLEIDHIFPISKGGKSEYNNLQTLCHDCNVAKSNTVERGAINPKAQRQGVNISCELCGAPMRIVKGKYGDFYGCSNYPKCKFTKQK